MTSDFIAHIRKSDGEKQTVSQHLIETAAIAREHAQKIGLPLMGELCGLLHDFGKYSDEFQDYIKFEYRLLDPDAETAFIDAKRNETTRDHATSGAQWLWKNCKQEDPIEKLLLSQMLALCIASHHSRGGLLDCIRPDGHDRFSERMKKADNKSHLSEVMQKIETSILQKAIDLINSPEILKEIETQITRVYETERTTPHILYFRLGLLTRFLFSCLIDADRTNTANFTAPEIIEQRWNGKYVDWSKLIQALENRLAKFTIENEKVDPLRKDISEHCRNFAERSKNLYSLTVPTGGGKTLASLRFALYHAQAQQPPMTRIIYVVPFTSIIDQNAEEVRKIFYDLSQQEQKEIVLEHHSNLAPQKETPQGKIITENWDAPIIYTTAVQFLEALFGTGTRSVRRLHQLTNAVIIFDEIQTLPVRMVHIFNNAINFLLDLCGSTVVFCTATQPCLHKVEPMLGAVHLTDEQEMMPNVRELFRKLRRVEVQYEKKLAGWSEQEIAELAFKCVQSTKSVLIIVNTKPEAKRLYQLCKELLCKEEYDSKDKPAIVYHLSTNMCPAHRLDILAKVKKCLDYDAPSPVICISTQLIEAGVDLDFGEVIRYLAGLDSIAQAAGRCNRNGRREMGYVYVVNVANENLTRLEDIQIAQDNTETVWSEYQKDPQAFDHNIIGDEAMKRYYHYYFFQRAKEMTYPVKELDDNLLTLLSSNEQSVKRHDDNQKKPQQIPPLILKQSFQSAAKTFNVIDTTTQGVIVPYKKKGKKIINELCAAFDLAKQFNLLKEAQRYSVNLFPNAINRLFSEGAIFEVQNGSGIFYLLQQFYSPDFGIAHEVVNEMEFLYTANEKEEDDDE